MNLVNFYIKVLKSFNDNNVEYMIVGGHAVNYYGYIRATLDLDIWVNNTDKNLDNLFNALRQVGYSDGKCKEAISNFKENHIIKIPEGNDIIELLDSFIMKDEFETIFRNCETTTLNNVELVIIGYNELLSCKYKFSRPKDILDVKILKDIEQITKKSKKNN